jgi:hypothetical protein
MKNAELIGLMIANTNKTKNLRTYGKHWFSGARRISDCISTQIGRMVALLQDRIDKGEIINGKKESLLIYNFQPLFTDNVTHYVSFDMVIKPISEINNTHDLSGEPLQVVVDCTSGEIMNNAKALMKIGIPPSDADDTQKPTTYGSYKHYRAIASFAILRFPHNDVNLFDIMAGKLDRTSLVQSSLAFDSFVEAREYLSHDWENYCMIAELNYPKEEHPQRLLQGVVGRHIIKLIHPYKPQVVPANQQMVIGPKEERIDDEIHCILDAAKEHASKPDFGIAIQ